MDQHQILQERFIANPIGQIWSGAMMLDYLGEKEASDRIINSIETTFIR